MDPTNPAADNDLQVDLQAAQALYKFHAEGDVRAVRLLATRLAAQPRSGPLADLVRTIDGQTATRPPTDSGTLDAASATDKAAPQVELQTVQRFRQTWARLRVDNQLTRSQEMVLENFGAAELPSAGTAIASPHAGSVSRLSRTFHGAY